MQEFCPFCLIAHYILVSIYFGRIFSLDSLSKAINPKSGKITSKFSFDSTEFLSLLWPDYPISEKFLKFPNDRIISLKT
jgi:hypothetical protein